MVGADKGTFVIVVAAEERKLMTLKIPQNVKKSFIMLTILIIVVPCV